MFSAISIGMVRNEFSKIFYILILGYASIMLVVNDKKKNNLILIKLKNSMKKMIKIAFVAAFVAIAGYGVYDKSESRVHVGFDVG